MSEWQPIESAPRDGTVVLTKRDIGGVTMGPYRSRFAPLAADAPIRSPASGGLYGDIPAENEYADIPGWCHEDCRHHVPTPTHWKPASATPDAREGE